MRARGSGPHYIEAKVRTTPVAIKFTKVSIQLLLKMFLNNNDTFVVIIINCSNAVKF